MTRTRTHLEAGKERYTEIRDFSLDSLALDPNNVRFKHYRTPLIADEMERIIWDEPDTKKLLTAILNSGGLSEEPYVSPDGIVLEGNRRVVCLRKARELQRQGRVDERIPQGAFDPVPVRVFVNGISDTELAVARARWHVSGKKDWDAINQAHHLYEMHDGLGMSYDYISGSLGMGKATVVKKVRAYQLMSEYMQATGDGDINRYSYFEELQKNRRARTWLEEDPHNRALFFSWIRGGRLNRTGAKDVRQLMDVLEDDDARYAFEADGGDMVKAMFEMQAKNPAINSRTFAALDKAIEALRRMPRAEYEAIPDNEAQVQMLEALGKEISDALEHLGID